MRNLALDTTKYNLTQDKFDVAVMISHISNSSINENI
jgi:hypothetical protein